MKLFPILKLIQTIYNLKTKFIKINPEINNKDILEEKIREMLSTYSSTCLRQKFQLKKRYQVL